MTIMQMIGAAMLAMPFVVIFVFLVRDTGLKEAVLIFAAVGVLIVWLVAAIQIVQA